MSRTLLLVPLDANFVALQHLPIERLYSKSLLRPKVCQNWKFLNQKQSTEDPSVNSLLRVHPIKGSNRESLLEIPLYSWLLVIDLLRQKLVAWATNILAFLVTKLRELHNLTISRIHFLNKLCGSIH